MNARVYLVCTTYLDGVRVWASYDRRVRERGGERQ